MFSPTWPPGAQPNGIVTYVGWMRSELLRQGHRVSIIAGRIDSDQAEHDVHEVTSRPLEKVRRKLASYVLNEKPSVFNYGKGLAAAFARLHATDPIDIVEMEESFGWAADVARNTGIPVVVKLHGPSFLHLVEEEQKTQLGIDRMRREGVALATLPAIVAPARCTLLDTIARYQLKPAIGEQVVNPISIPDDTPLWRLDRCDRNTLLFVGRFDKVKGGDLILLAFQHLLSSRPDLKLVFVGPDNGLLRPNGETLDIHTFIASMGDEAVARAVSYRGRVGRTEVGVLRTQALVTVVASRQENQAYTVLEAMLQGCPVVCTDNSGSSESIEHEVTGLLARSEDPIALATQIARIIDDPQLGVALGEAGRAYVLEQHAPAAVVTQMTDVYRRTIALRQPGLR